MFNPFVPGDRVRILVDEPYNTPLAAGEIVTVVGTEIGASTEGGEGPIVVVTTNLGQFRLFLDVVERVDEPVKVDGRSLEGLGYLPAPPNPAVDDLLLGLLAAEADLRAFFLDADTALGAEAPGVSTQLATSTDDKPCWHDGISSNDVLTGQDSYGDEFQIVYDEMPGVDGTRQGRFYLSVNDSEDVIISPYYMHRLLHWVAARLRRSQRPGL